LKKGTTEGGDAMGTTTTENNGRERELGLLVDSCFGMEKRAKSLKQWKKKTEAKEKHSPNENETCA
jgi:hypothetical protein